jgi:hypothetical protein
MEQLNKHVSEETNSSNNRIGVFSMRSVLMGYEKDKVDRLSQSRSGVPSEQLSEELRASPELAVGRIIEKK